jgi:hypothetical protein
MPFSTKAIDKQVVYDARGVASGNAVCDRDRLRSALLSFEHAKNGVHDGVLASVFSEAKIAAS